MEAFTRKNHRIWMVTIYLLLVSAFLKLRPSVAFGREGRVRPFGVVDKEATIFPVWWWIFILAAAAQMITLQFARFQIA